MQWRDEEQEKPSDKERRKRRHEQRGCDSPSVDLRELTVAHCSNFSSTSYARGTLQATRLARKQDCTAATSLGPFPERIRPNNLWNATRQVPAKSTSARSQEGLMLAMREKLPTTPKWPI